MGHITSNIDRFQTIPVATMFRFGLTLMPNSQQVISVVASIALVVSSMGLEGCKKKESQADQQAQAPAATFAMPTADQLYQLVAPIALFPDNLVAIVLASSTYPDQITASWQWLQQNGGLKGADLMQSVDQQPWDASVKGLTQFPDVVQQMATNLSWTSSLGDAYFNAPQNVMNAVQVMRQRAYQAGNLKSTPQQNVQVENQPAGTEPAPASSGNEDEQPPVTVVQSPPQTIVIQPAQPDVVYVPSYNPTVVYGEPIPPAPGYSTADMVTTGLVSFGVGMLVGAAISNNNNNCCGWGYNSWNTGWNNSSVHYNNNVYISNSNTFVNRNNYNNVNRNNINGNNINRNNINANNINRNDLNRGGTPQFDQRRNQGVGDRNQGIGDRNQGVGNRNQVVGDRNQGVGNRNQGVGDRNQGVGNRNQGVGDRNQGVGNRNQGVGDRNQGAGNRNQGVGDRNQGAGNRNQGGGNQRTEQRGYGNQPNRGASNNAMGNYKQGGNARNDSARGKQSVNGGGNRGGANTAQARGGGGGAKSGGGNRSGGAKGGGAKSGGSKGGGGRKR